MLNWSFLYFLGHVSVQILFPFFNQVLYFVVVNYKSSLNNLHINPLSDVQFADIFCHSVGCLFTLLIESFDAQIFLILKKFSLFIFFLLLLVFLVLHCQIFYVMKNFPSFFSEVYGFSSYV